MTWWEVEEIMRCLNEIESELDEWSYSNPKMKIEKERIVKLGNKINRALPVTTEAEKKDFLVHLAGRIEELQEHLVERLKREVSRPESVRNLLS